MAGDDLFLIKKVDFGLNPKCTGARFFPPWHLGSRQG